jgi:hypothetical protein
MKLRIKLMNILKKSCYLLLLALLLVSCAQENKYIIEKGKVGNLTTKTHIKDLHTIFENDSIHVPVLVEKKEGQNFFFSDADEYEIFSNKGERLLAITPDKENDSVSTIKSIQIFDAKYKTAKGIGILSTFKQIKKNYIINKIETTLTSATIYIDELNATISIDKEEIGISKFSREEIFVEQIPDDSKIKYFTIWFN